MLLKDIYNRDLITKMAINLAAVDANFQSELFIQNSLKNIEKLSFKQRAAQIAQQLVLFLPSDFPSAAKICIQSFENPLDQEQNRNFGLQVFYYLPFSDYVVLKGLKEKYLKISFDFMKEITQRFSAEFCIRHFLIEFPQQSIDFLKKCAVDKNLHLRRLASEGIRPLLPWGLKLPEMIQNPNVVFDILALLVNDKSDYVLKSVGNNLNDLSKYHPLETIHFLEKNCNSNQKNHQKITKLALRTLIKKGHPKALHFMGYRQDFKINCTWIKSPKTCKFGELINFEIELENLKSESESLVLDFSIDFVRLQDKTQNKVFKWKNMQLEGNQKITFSKNYSFKAISTRKYYPGIHHLNIHLNGKVVVSTSFLLKR